MTLSRLNNVEGLPQRRIFVSGGTGFIGRSLLDYFAEVACVSGLNFRVVVLSRDPEGFIKRYPFYAKQKWLSFVKGSLSRLPPPDSYTDVIHAAADTHSSGDSLGWLNQLIGGTEEMLKFAKASDAKRFLFISSGAIYGSMNQEKLIQENTLTAPSTTNISSIYAEGKRVSELMCAIYTEQKSLPCVIARCFSVISHHVPLDGPYAVGNFIRDALSDERSAISICGDGSSIRSYLDGRDMASWMLALLERGVFGEAYNIGSDSPITILNLARKIRDVFSPGKKILILDEKDKYTKTIYMPDVKKAFDLGLRPMFNLDQSLKKIVQQMHDK